MFWSTTCCRLWWLLPMSLGLLGSLLLLRITKRSPEPTPTATLAPQPVKVNLRVPGVVSSPLGSEEHMVALGDFNGDNQLDLAITDQDYDSSEADEANLHPQGEVILWFGEAKGGLRRGPALPGVDAVVLASLDADGDGDAALLTTGPLQLWRNEGRGKLVPRALPTPAEWEGQVDDLATGDVDGDGDVDIVLSSFYRLGLGLNDGRGRWHFAEVAQKLATTTGEFRRVALADVDGDHDLDIVSPGERGILLLNDGRGRFDGEQRRLPTCTSASAAIGDLNGDGRPDLVLDVSGIDEHKLGVFLNDGTGHFGAAALSQTLENSRTWVALGDVDRDGDVDVVTGSGGWEVWVYRNGGRAQFEPAYEVALPSSDIQELHLADCNHDGWLDVLSPSAVRPGRHRPLRATLPTLRAPTGHEYYQVVDQPPSAVGGGPVQPVVSAAMQARLVLPPGYSLSPAYSPYWLSLLVGKDGQVERAELEERLAPAVDSSMLDTLRQLRFVPGRLRGRAVRVLLHLRSELSGQGPPRTLLSPEPDEAPLYAQVEQMPTLRGGRPLVPVLREQVLNQLILPDSLRVPPHGRLVIGVVVEKDGTVEQRQRLADLPSVIPESLIPGVRLSSAAPGRHHGRRVRVALRVPIELTGPHAPLRQLVAGHLEDQTWQRRHARRRPGETDAQFVRRVLPLTLADNGGNVTTHTWRPSAFGKQLFLTRSGQDGNEGGTDLLVLDPYRPATYTLRVLPVTPLDDDISLVDFFFADVDDDGQLELLALKRCNLRGTRLSRHGRETYSGSEPRFATQVFHLARPDRTGRPRYRLEEVERAYLDDLPTVAAVQRALAQHARAQHHHYRAPAAK